MVLLEADPFLTELMAMYKGNRVRGSVVVTMKRSSCRTPKKQLDAKEEDYVCLVRATDGKRKISTMVPASKQARFQDAYVTILKASTDKLKRPAESVKKPQGGAAKSKGASHGDASKG